MNARGNGHQWDEKQQARDITAGAGLRREICRFIQCQGGSGSASLLTGFLQAGPQFPSPTPSHSATPSFTASWAWDQMTREHPESSRMPAPRLVSTVPPPFSTLVPGRLPGRLSTPHCFGLPARAWHCPVWPWMACCLLLLGVGLFNSPFSGIELCVCARHSFTSAN